MEFLIEMCEASMKPEKQQSLTVVRLHSYSWKQTLLNIIWHKNAPFIFNCIGVKRASHLLYLTLRGNTGSCWSVLCPVSWKIQGNLSLTSNCPAGIFAYQTLFLAFVYFQRCFAFAQFVGEFSGTEDVCSC